MQGIRTFENIDWEIDWSLDTLISCRSSHLRCSVIKGVLRNFAKVCKILQKETLTQVFSYELCEISKNIFLQNTSGWLLLAKLNKTLGAVKSEQ